MDKLVTISEASRQLGISRPSLYKKIRKGAIPYHDFDGSYRLDLDEIRRATRVKAAIEKAIGGQFISIALASEDQAVSG